MHQANFFWGDGIVHNCDLQLWVLSPREGDREKACVGDGSIDISAGTHLYLADKAHKRDGRASLLFPGDGRQQLRHSGLQLRLKSVSENESDSKQPTCSLAANLGTIEFADCSVIEPACRKTHILKRVVN